MQQVFSRIIIYCVKWCIWAAMITVLVIWAGLADAILASLNLVFGRRHLNIFVAGISSATLLGTSLIAAVYFFGTTAATATATSSVAKTTFTVVAHNMTMQLPNGVADIPSASVQLFLIVFQFVRRIFVIVMLILVRICS